MWSSPLRGRYPERIPPLQENSKLINSKFKIIMKNKTLETVVKIIVAALTAFLTALTTTSCAGFGPF
jgi:hypothetical protein